MDRKLFKNVMFNMLRTLSSIIYPLITAPYIARILAVSDVGTVNFASSYVDLFIIVASLGIPTYALREGTKKRNDKNEISDFLSSLLSLMFIVGVLIAVVYFLTVLLGNTFAGHRFIFFLYGMVILINFMDVYYVFSIYEDFKYVTIRTALIQLLCLVILFLFVRTPEDVYWYIFTLLFSRCGSACINFVYSKKYIKWRFTLSKIRRNDVSAILTFFFISIASNIYLLADKVMLGFMCTAEVVALYSAATRIIQIFRNMVATLTTVCLPRAVYYCKEDTMKEYRELIVSVISLILMITIPIAIGSYCIGQDVVVLIYSEAYIGATAAFKILASNCTVALINGVLAYQILSPLKKEKVVFVATLVGCLVNIVLNVFLLPKYGQSAAAVTTLISEMVTFSIMIPYCKKELEFKRIMRAIGQYVIACVPFVLLFLSLESYIHDSFICLIIFCLISMISYFGVLSVLKNEFIDKVISTVIRKGDKKR